MNNLPELLAPAGDIEKAKYAFQYGADAIYCGIPMFSLRTQTNYFTEDHIEEIIKYAHKIDKKVFVTVNGFPHQCAVKLLIKHLKFIEKVKPDALIIADCGVLSLANEHCPSIEKHMSVQTTTLNVPAIKFWQQNNVKRIILAREITISEVKRIHDLVPDVELEYFVHGSMCMSYSGRCLISSYLTGRDANRGTCANCCRWNYKIYDENGNELDVSDKEKSCSSECNTSKSIREFEKKQYWEEELRKGEFIPVYEDFHGTHIMSSRDMCMIEKLQDIVDAGVCSLKVEGRNKTISYLSTVIRAYQKALDNLDKPFDKKLLNEILATANRGFFTGFLNGKPHSEGQQYEANISKSTHEFVGVVSECKNGRLIFDVKNRINEGDILEFIFPNIDDDIKITAEEMIKNEKNVTALHGGNGIGSIKCALNIPEGIIIRKKV